VARKREKISYQKVADLSDAGYFQTYPISGGNDATSESSAKTLLKRGG